MNRQMFGFLSLLGVGIAIWTVVQGIGTFFTAFASSWTPEATNTVASSIASLIWLGGVVFVLVCGYAMFATFNRWSRVSGRSAGSQTHSEYIVANDPHLLLPDSQPQQMIEAQSQTYQWHDPQTFQSDKAQFTR